MKLAISGSRRTTSSASRRMRDQIGSTLSSAVARLVRCCAIDVYSRLLIRWDAIAQAQPLREPAVRAWHPSAELAQKPQDRGREAVVAVARHHVPGAGHVHIFSVRDKFQE